MHLRFSFLKNYLEKKTFIYSLIDICSGSDLSHLSAVQRVLTVLDEPEQNPAGGSLECIVLSEIRLVAGNWFEGNLFVLLQDEVISAHWPVKSQRR